MPEKEITEFISKIGCESKVNKMHINYSEFIAATLDKHSYLNRERLWSLFQYFDTD
jgi:Ca2+-binding EF-hand superfamily protein